MKVPGLGFAAALLLMALAPTAAFAVQDSTPSAHPDTEALNRAMNDESPPTAIDAEQRAKGKKDVPALLAASKAPCTMTDAMYVGAGTGTDKVHANYYEVACQEGLGYLIVSKDKNPTPDLVDCVKLSSHLPDGKPNPLACKLPGNRHPALGLQAMVTKAGHTCTVNGGRFIGSTTTTDYYEVACTEGGGYILEATHDGAAPKTNNCLIYGQSGNIKCTLTTEAQQNTYVDKMVAADGKPCDVAARRYVASGTDGSDYYEVACADKTGFMLKTNPNGAFSGMVIPCSQASGLGDGCKLTDAREAMTKEAGLYSNLAKKAGFDCDVSKYADFPGTDNNMEIVELACNNRPDGGVGFFSTNGGRSKVLDCLRAEDEGYKCSYTPNSALYAKLTAQLRAKNKNLCVVNNAVAFAQATSGDGKGKDDLVEVGCADGGPGFVLDYLDGQTEPTELLNCAQVKSMGGCKLASKQ